MLNARIKQGLLLFSLVIAGYACATVATPEAEENAAPEITAPTEAASPFHRGVGATIPGETALRWMDAYQQKHPNEVRSHFYGREAFERILARPASEGISIEHAINDAGEQVLVLIPLDKNGKRLPDGEALQSGKVGDTQFYVEDGGLTCPPFCARAPTDELLFSRTVGSPIPASTALRWIETYQKRHPNEVRSHFYGRNTFERLLARPGCEGISVQRAINDEGKYVLVLIPLDKSGNRLPNDEALRTGKMGDTQFYVEDSGIPCPPTCGE